LHKTNICEFAKQIFAQIVTKKYVEKTLNKLKCETKLAQKLQNTLFEYFSISNIIDDINNVKY